MSDTTTDPTSIVIDEITYTVTGTVTAPGSAALAGLTVQLADKNVGGDTVLNAAVTDASGRFSIQAGLSPQYLAQNLKSAPDLQVRLVENDAVVATSIVRYGASTAEELDLALDAGQATLPSEYEALSAAITSVYPGSLAGLQENAQAQDVTYLANRTGWDGRAIAMAAQAAALSAPTAAGFVQAPPAPFYYALLRAGLPADPDQLHATDAASVQAVWTQAIADNLLPAALNDSVQGALASFQTVAAGRALNAAPAVGASTLGALIGNRFGQNTDQPQQFAALLAGSRADPGPLWDEAGKLFGPGLTAQLQLDGQLAYLTVNNAPLVQALQAGNVPINNPVDLVAAGYHDAGGWLPLLANIAAPPEFTADSPEQAKADYAQALAAHVRLSFPTATLGQVVATSGLGVDSDSQQAVTAFLAANADGFDVGAEPVGQFLARTGLAGDPLVVAHVERLQRLYQISPDLDVLAGLAAAGFDSARAVAQWPAARFVTVYGAALGGADVAALTHSRALTIHATTLQVTLSYLAGRRVPALGPGNETLIDPAAGLANSQPNTAAFAEATLADLFGSLDYCQCDDCRSLLSPAAYLVDLLDYLDNPSPTAGFSNPLDALTARRPDIGALPLTCENTNTALPYIDLVNEILEFYVGHADSLAGYPGHTTDDTVSSAQLIAAPQNDDDASAQAAYSTLGAQLFPIPLPFERDLELLRAHVTSLGSTLYDVLRVLRPRDTLDPAPGDDATFYGWRDILIERLGLSRTQIQLLTDSATISVQALYGYPDGTDVAAAVSCLQEFSRRTGVSYDDIVTILATTTVNPNSALLPLLQALQVPLSVLAELNDGTLDAADFAALLPAGIDPARYQGSQLTDIAAWVTNNYATLMQLIVIDVTGSPSDPTTMFLAHLDPTAGAQALDDLDLYRLMRFIRLWRALGRSITATDQLVQALFGPTDPDTDTDLQKLDSGGESVVLLGGLAYRAIDVLGLDPGTDLPSLLTCWGPMSSNGPDSLYAGLFLNPTVLAQDVVFAPDVTGAILSGGPAATVLAHQDTLCAALGLTGSEFDLLTGSGPAIPGLPALGLGYDATTPLTLDTVSALYRTAWLARTLQISILELLALATLSAIDPFALPVLQAQTPVSAGLLDFIDLVAAMSAAGLTPVQACYLLWNVDLSGVSAPPASAAPTLAVQLRSAFAAIEAQFSVPADPTLAGAQTLMALVLGPAGAGWFFGLLTGGYLVSVPFGYSQAMLPAAVLAAANGRISYDDLAKQLTSAGYLDPATASAAQTAAGADATLVAAIGALATAAQAAKTAFLQQYQNDTLQLAGPFEDYFSSPDPTVVGSLSALLAGLLPVLAAARRQSQALAVISSVAGTDPSLAAVLLGAAAVMPAAGDPAQPAVSDLTAVAAGGLSLAFHLDDDLTSAPATPAPPPTTLDFSGTGLTLPSPAAGHTTIAVQATGYLVADQAGRYGLELRTDAGATLTLSVDGVDAGMTSTADGSGLTWANTGPITLSASTPSTLLITATGLGTTFAAQWQTTGTGWTPVPAANLFAATTVTALGTTLVRFLKIAALAGDLLLDSADLAWLAGAGAAGAGLDVGGATWTAVLAADAPAPAGDFADLTALLSALLVYAALKAAHGGTDDRLPAALSDLTSGAGTTRLCSVTGWDVTSLTALSTRILGADLAAARPVLPALQRLGDAFDLLATCKLAPAALIAAAGVAPSSDQLDAFAAAVRSRYSEADWLTAVQAINDQVRRDQRDALVAHVLVNSGPDILATLGVAATLNRMPTPDDLFSYFLVDAQMQPCMLTSRIRHALSSIQLFAERCLRNLEPAVNPNDLDAQEWVWRSRYRVWQANREVFLWPENWMDESLRDDPSPFFKTAMSQLLQSDITDDAAASAYLDYLSNLEQVAHLEPCGLYVEAATDGSGDDTVHVVARTAGAHRKYYYRRFTGGSWTPWADTKLSVEDNPVVPYVWNGRLLLFWVQIHRSSAIDTTNPGATLPGKVSGEQNLANTSLSDITGRLAGSAATATGERISVVLCFSEYYNGAWQPVKTSDTASPMYVQTMPSGTFDRSTMQVRPWMSSDPSDQSLYVEIAERIDQPWLNPTFLFLEHGFVVHNTHSAPVPASDSTARIMPFQPNRVRSLPPINSGSATALVAGYATRTSEGPWGPQYTSATMVDLLTGTLPQTLRQAQFDVADQWSMPFLASDARSAFFVTSSVSYRWFGTFAGYGLAGPGQILRDGSRFTQLPQVVVNRPPTQPDPPIEITGRLADPEQAQSALAQAGGMRAVFGSASTVQYNGAVIGATGAVAQIEQSQEDQ